MKACRASIIPTQACRTLTERSSPALVWYRQNVRRYGWSLRAKEFRLPPQASKCAWPVRQSSMRRIEPVRGSTTIFVLPLRNSIPTSSLLVLAPEVLQPPIVALYATSRHDVISPVPPVRTRSLGGTPRQVAPCTFSSGMCLCTCLPGQPSQVLAPERALRSDGLGVLPPLAGKSAVRRRRYSWVGPREGIPRTNLAGVQSF